jgi:hypothetical protein
MRSKARLTCFALIMVWAMPVEAHDIYTHLKNERGAACCDGTDCRPAHYRIKGGHVQMLVDGKWFPIFDDAITYRVLEGDTGETNGGHWCGKRQSGMSWDYLHTHCAVLPPKVTSAR